MDAARQLVQRHCAGRSLVEVLCLEGGGGPRHGQFDDKVVTEGLPARL